MPAGRPAGREGAPVSLGSPAHLSAPGRKEKPGRRSRRVGFSIIDGALVVKTRLLVVCSLKLYNPHFKLAQTWGAFRRRGSEWLPTT